MAKATKRPIPEPEYEVVLTLSGTEAETLQTVLGYISGDCGRGRKMLSSIYDALHNVGVCTKDGGFFSGRWTDK